MSGDPARHNVWRWYWVLLIANALDLLFTYTAAERGVEEANAFLQPLLLTPWPAILKFYWLGILAIALVAAMPLGITRLRVLLLLRVATYVYVGVVIFHLIGLYLPT
jgi:hypothetical protein